MRFVVYIFVLLFTLNSFTALGQDKAELAAMGRIAYDEGDYFLASGYYEAALKLDSSDLLIAFQLGNSYRLYNSYADALAVYEFLVKTDSKERYPAARFYLALMLKQNGEYDEACRAFNRLSASPMMRRLKQEQKILLEKELETCSKIDQLLEDTANVRIRHLSQLINTPYSEFGAVQVGDSILWFSAIRPLSKSEFNQFLPVDYLSTVFSSEIKVSGFREGIDLPRQVNRNNSHNANITYDPRNNRIFFSRCMAYEDALSNCKIMTSRVKGKSFKKAVVLNDKINLPDYTNTQPCIAKSGKHNVLYFVSNRPGGYGGMDIWYAIEGDNGWGTPINCGSNINTPGNEVTPFFDERKQTLYYSSDWKDGLGGYDIFSAKGSLSSWETSENLGVPFNSPANDIYYTVNTTDSSGYFTSNRNGSYFIKGETCCNDIYSFEWLSTEDIIDTVIVVEIPTDSIEEKAKALLPLVLYFHNDEPDPGTLSISSTKDYKKSLDEYVAMKEKYRNEYSRGLNDTKKAEAIAEIDKFFDQHVMGGYEKLDQLTEYLLTDLEQGNTVQLWVRGYCSPLNTNDYNINLARRRINSLYKYLEQANDSMIAPYLNNTAENGASLLIYEDPVGEERSNPFVSDNPHDVRNSVYSRSAAFERRIEIVLYTSGADSSMVLLSELPSIIFPKDTFSLDTLDAGTKKTFIVPFSNDGKSQLMIRDIEYDQNKISVQWSNEPVLPGERSRFYVLVMTEGLKGEISEDLIITTNIPGQKERINIKVYVR